MQPCNMMPEASRTWDLQAGTFAGVHLLAHLPFPDANPYPFPDKANSFSTPLRTESSPNCSGLMS